MTISEPNPSVRETGAEVDEFLDAPPAAQDDAESGGSADDGVAERDADKGSPTPNPGEPDVRGVPAVTQEPDAAEVRRGTAAPHAPNE